MSDMDEVAGLLHIVEKTSDHGTKFANIRAAAMQKLSEIEAEHADGFAKAKEKAKQEEAQAAARLEDVPPIEEESGEAEPSRPVTVDRRF